MKTKTITTIVAYIIMGVVIGVGISYLAYYLSLPSPAQKQPSRETLDVSRYTGIFAIENNSIRCLTVFGEAQNNLTSNVKSVEAVVSVYDEENNVIVTNHGYVEVEILESGQEAPFEVYLSLNISLSTAYPRYTVTSSGMKTNEKPFRGFQVLSENKSVSSDGYYTVGAEIQNNGSVKAYLVKIFCIYYNSSDNSIISISHVWPSKTQVLAPGDMSSIEISSWPFKTGTQCDYKLVVVAHHYDYQLGMNYMLLFVLIAIFVALIVFMKRRGW